MIKERTWHPNPDNQKEFHWESTENGITVKHPKGNTYNIPWKTFHEVYIYARKLASESDGTAIAGTSMDSPTKNSVGSWVIEQKLKIAEGHLTPRHLSFIGSILGRMGFISRQLKGNSILWSFTQS